MKFTYPTRKQQLEKTFIASAAKLITDKTCENNWSLISGIFMFSDEANKTKRLYRSQAFKDADYPDRVHLFFQNAYEVDPERTLSMITCVIQDLGEKGILGDSDLDRYPIIKAFLEEKDSVEFFLEMPKARERKLLNIKDLPDNFYYDLIESINVALHIIYTRPLMF